MAGDCVRISWTCLFRLRFGLRPELQVGFTALHVPNSISLKLVRIELPLITLIWSSPIYKDYRVFLLCGLLRRFAFDICERFPSPFKAILMRLEHENLRKDFFFFSGTKWKKILWIIDLLIPTGDRQELLTQLRTWSATSNDSHLRFAGPIKILTQKDSPGA